MNNRQCFKLVFCMLFALSFQKLIAQPQFVIEDKVVFVAGASQSSTPQNSLQPVVKGVIEDEVVFVASAGIIKLDSVHKKLMNLKRTTSDKTNSFKWYNAHPTSSMNIEGYSIVITSTTTLPATSIAEVRLARQKTNVWVDTKFNKPAVLSEIKSIVYSLQNRKADIETYGGYKFSLTIDATTGQINLINALPNTVEVRVFKTSKLL